jgi:probable HAF family extracellular repeat protein
MTALPTLGGSSSGAGAIDQVGRAVGSSKLSLNSPSHAVLWENGGIVDLMPGSPDSGVAAGINASRQIVGTKNGAVAFLWQNGVMSDLGHLGLGWSAANDINDAGQVVGSSPTADPTPLGPMAHAFLWENGVMTDLGVLPGDQDSGAAAINSFGQIVGSTGRTDPDTYESFYRAFLYQNGTMTALPVPSSEVYAGDINDSGVVVGSMRAGGGVSNFHAWVYADGVATNLNSLIPAGSGLHLAYAQAINNAGQIVGTAFDARLGYHAFLLTPVAAGTPVANIADASVTEGNSGTRTATFTVTLSPASSQPVTVAYSTANGSATAGSDYQSTSGTVTFAAGQTTASIPVLVNGDRAGEANEAFLVNLSQAEGAHVADAQGVGTIVDDEPRVTINSVTKNEGNSGTTPFVFAVSLSAAYDAPVNVNFATVNGSAKSGEDYDAASGSIAFAAGETSQTVTVNVKGDRKVESQEVFYVNLSAAAGAFITSSQGTGVVKNDDR